MRSTSSLTAFAAATLACTLAISNAAAEVYGSAERTREHVIASSALGEDREIFVRTPPGYREDGREYPVVYVLDGEGNFELVASYLDYMLDNGIYPDMIVTGVRNVNRNRDYVPRADVHFDDTGGADAFLEFVKDEWIGVIEESYPTSGERILIGHSFGGVFTLHAFFAEPELFDAYIALSASAWIADRVLFQDAAALFRDGGDLDAFVYMAVGEGDGGPTIPSSRDLAALFEADAPASLEWTFDVTPKTDHFKNFASGMHDAFMALYPAWAFEDEVSARGEAAGAAGVEDWFDEKESELGFRFRPSWFDIGVAALGLSREGHGEAALAVMTRLRDYHPESPHIAEFTGWAYENLGQLDAAAPEYERARQIARDNGLHPNDFHIGRMERALARIQEKRSATP